MDRTTPLSGPPATGATQIGLGSRLSSSMARSQLRIRSVMVAVAVVAASLGMLRAYPAVAAIISLGAVAAVWRGTSRSQAAEPSSLRENALRASHL